MPPRSGQWLTKGIMMWMSFLVASAMIRSSRWKPTSLNTPTCGAELACDCVRMSRQASHGPQDLLTTHLHPGLWGCTHHRGLQRIAIVAWERDTVAECPRPQKLNAVGSHDLCTCMITVRTHCNPLVHMTTLLGCAADPSQGTAPKHDSRSPGRTV